MVVPFNPQRKGHRGGGVFVRRTKWRFDMDEGATLFVTLVMILVVTAILTTGIHIIRPGEIGFIYRGRKFLRHTGPAFVFGPPIIGRVYRVKVESLLIVVESSVPRAEIQLGIADPSKVPMWAKKIESEIKTQVADLTLKALSRYGSDKSHLDTVAAAEDIKNRLDASVKDLGLTVVDLKLGEVSEKGP